MPYDENGHYFSSPVGSPLFDEDHQDVSLAGETHTDQDLPGFLRTGDTYTDRKKAKQWETIRMAHMKGDVSRDEAVEMMGADEDPRNIVEKVLGLNAHGTDHNLLMPLVDTFSPMLYASASYTKARMDAIERETKRARAEGEISDDETLPWYNSTRWDPTAFSGKEFNQYRKNRTMYGDVFDVDYNLIGFDEDGWSGAAWGALAADIALDPLTWTGIGLVGKAMKVAGLSDDAAKVFARTSGAIDVASQPVRAAKAAVKGENLVEALASSEGKVMKTTGWGEAYYGAVTNKIFSESIDDIAVAGAKVGDDLIGPVQSPWHNQKLHSLIKDRVPREMIERYDELAPEIWKQTHGRLTRMFKGNAEKAYNAMNKWFLNGQGKQLDLFQPPPITALFQETSPFWRKEVGLTTFGLAGKAGSTMMKSGSNMVDWNWVQVAAMEPTSKIAYKAIRDSAKSSAVQWERGIREMFKDFSREERKSITEILESEGSASGRNTQQTVARDYDPKLIDAAAKVRSVFDDIAEEEKKYGLLNDTIKGYVTHLFNGNPTKIDNYRQSLVKRNHWVDAEWGTVRENKFSLHRRIASIDELKSIFGDDAILTDVAEILYRRKRMSLEMVANRKWLLEIQTKHGFGAQLLEAAKSGVPESISRMMVNRQSTAYELSDLSQFWQHEKINLSNWGFRQGADKENMHLLRWMTSDASTRGVAVDHMRAGGFRKFTHTDKIGNYTGRINPKVDITRDEVIRTVDINNYLEALFHSNSSYGAAGTVVTPAMSDVVTQLGFRRFEDIPLSMHKKILGSFDKRLRREVGPLTEVVPELSSLFSRKGKFRTTWARSIPGAEPKKLDGLLEMLNKAEEIKLVPGLSDEVIIRAKEYRRKLGDHSDSIVPHTAIMDQIRGHLKNFDMKPSQTQELTEVLFNKGSLDKLSAREADQLELFLGINAMGGTKKGVMKGSAKEAYINRYAAYTGEQLVEVKMPAVPGSRPSLLQTNLSGHMGKLDSSVEAQSKHRAKVSEGHALNQARRTEWKSKKDELSNLFRDLKKAKAKQNTINKTKNNVAWLNAKSKVDKLTKQKDNFISVHGDAAAMDKKIKEFANKEAASKVSKADAAAKLRHSKNVRSWMIAEDKALRNPADKAARKNAKKLKRDVRKGEKRFGLPETKAPVASTKKIPAKETKDPRYGAEEAIGAFEQPAVGLEVQRTAGTVGPDITIAGESIENFRYASYWLPKSMAGMLDDINTNMYGHKLGRLFKGYDYIQAYFKARVMAMFPEFHKRNGVTDLGLATLRAGMGLFHREHWDNYSRLLAYGLSKESISFANVPRSMASSGAVLGAEAGAISGAFVGAQEGEGFLDTTAQMVGGALKGGVVGAAGVGALGGTAGGALKLGLTGIKKHRGPAKELGETLVKLDNGVEFTVKEFYEEMGKRGIFNTQVSVELLEETGSLLHAMADSAGMKAPNQLINAAKAKQTIFMQDAFRAGELATTIPMRIMLFTQTAKQSGNLGVATQAVKKYLYDYSNMTMFERRVMRRMIPFYTWTKHALGANYDAIVNHPARYAQQIRPFVSMAKDDGVDPADYPDWLSNRLSRFSVKFNERTGEREVIAKQGYGLVQEELIGVWKDLAHSATVADPWLSGKPSDAPSKILARGPLGVSSVLEGLANFDSFRQGNILATATTRSAYDSGKEWDKAPAWIQRAVGYERDERTGKSKVDPRASWMLREVPQSRAFNIAKQAYELDEDGRRNVNWLSLSRSLLGEKVYTYGPDNTLYEDRARIERVAQWLYNLRLAAPMTISVPTEEYRRRKQKKSTLY